MKASVPGHWYPTPGALNMEPSCEDGISRVSVVGGGSGAGIGSDKLSASSADVGSAVVVVIDVDVVGAGFVLLEVEELVVEVGVLLVSTGAAPLGLEHEAKVSASTKIAGMSLRMGATFW